MEIKELVDDYLNLCKIYCNEGGFSKLDLNIEEIKQELIKKYSNNGNAVDLSRLIDRIYSEMILFSQKESIRLISWMDDFYERKLREELNTVLLKA